jgi:SAM-dependent methyltransferase
VFDNGWGYSELHDCQEVEQQGRGLSSKAMPKACNVGYDTPMLLRKLVDDVIDKSKRNAVWALKGADLDCGSGCSGLAFRSCVLHLTGIDISPEMVDKARGRGCYDRLLVGDIGSVLGTSEEGSVESANDAAFDMESLASEFGFETKAMKTSDIQIHEGRVIKGVLAVMTLSSAP